MKVSNPQKILRKYSATKSLSAIILLVHVLSCAQPCTQTWYKDFDDDGFGNANINTTVACSATPLAGYVLNSLDCNDSTANEKSWNVAEAPSLSNHTIRHSVLKSSENGNLFLLYQDNISANDIPISIKKFNGRTWTAVGSAPVSSDLMFGADLAISAQDEAYISYLDFVAPANGNNKASVLKFNGSAWVQLGSKRFSNALADNCSVSIAISNTGIPYVLTCAANGNPNVYEYEAASDKWKTVGNTNFVSFAVPKGDLKIDKAGTLYVTFVEASSGKISMITYNGSSWNFVGAAGISDYRSDMPQSYISESGEKYVSYFDLGNDQIVVKKMGLGSATWTALGAAVHSGASSNVTMTADRYGLVYIAYRNDATATVTIKKYNGNSWIEVAENLTDDGQNISLALDPVSNLPAFSYQNFSQSGSATVRTLGYEINAPSLTGISNAQSTLCQGRTASLSANGSLNHAAQWSWYNQSCGGTRVGTGSTLTVSPDDTTAYFVRAEGGCLGAPAVCASTIIQVLDTVHVVTTLAPSSICEGSGFNIGVQSIRGSGVSYQWYKNNSAIPGATSERYSIPSTSSADGGVYKLLATGTCNSMYSSNSALTVSATTTIQSQLSDIVVCENLPATFALDVDGSALSYQWYKDGVAIGGATNATLTFAAVSIADAGWYSVAVNGSCGSQTSLEAELEVLRNPIITAQPTHEAVCLNGNATFVVQVSGKINSYQWYKNGSIISGATNNQLSLTSITSAHAGNYYVAIEGDCGTIRSNTVALQLNTPSYIAAQPDANIEVCIDNDYTIQITPSKAGLSFQWYTDELDGNGWQLLSGATQPTFNLTNVTNAKDGFHYQATVSSATDGCSIQSNVYTIDVVMPPVIYAHPVHQTTCLGSNANFTASATGNDLHYQWQQKENGAWRDVSGENSSNLFIDNASLAQHDTYFRLKVWNTACREIHSESAKLSVYNTPGEGPCLTFLVTEAITPNGDGILDQWIIQGIERFPDNDVKIFNIWGDIIFEASGYDNENNCWSGKNHRNGIMDGAALPDGNYFYQLNLGDGSALKTGFIRLKR